MLENDLTNIEMLIMKCIWDTPEELALSQLVAMVNERFEKSWKPQTISTYLAHLVRKGYLSMRRKGKVFLYHPEVSEESYRSSQIDELVNYWGDLGTPTEFLSALFVTPGCGRLWTARSSAQPGRSPPSWPPPAATC